MDFPASQPIGSPAFPKIELLTICNFRQRPKKKKVLSPHKFVKFILILSSPFLSFPLHLLESKCHWERITFGLIWNVKCSNLLLLPRKSSLKRNFSSQVFSSKQKRSPMLGLTSHMEGGHSKNNVGKYVE